MVDQITDHDDRMKELLIQQFKEQPNFQKMIDALAVGIQELEDVSNDMLEDRSINTAIGVQLDFLGELVGEDRLGRTDDDYRSAIRVRISINTSKGTPEDLISIFAALTNAGTVDYSELFPAFVDMFTNGDLIPDFLVDNMNQVKPAGVALILSSSQGGIPFALHGDFDGEGLSDTNQPTIGGELSGILS